VAAPLPRRVPQVPPPPFGVVTSAGAASLFEPPARGSATSELRAAAHLPMETPPRDRSDVSGLWAGAAAARGEQRPAPEPAAAERGSDLWQPRRSAEERDGGAAAAEEPDRWARSDAGRSVSEILEGEVLPPLPAEHRGTAEPTWDEVVASLDTPAAPSPRPPPPAPQPGDTGPGWTVVSPLGEPRERVGPSAGPADAPRHDEGWATGAPTWDGDDDVVGARVPPARGSRRRDDSGRTGSGWPDASAAATGDPTTHDRAAWAPVVEEMKAGDPAPAPTGAPRAAAGPVPTPYEEEPTEVLGPFDIGQWTVQAGRVGPAPDRVQARASTGTREERGRGSAQREPDERLRDRVPVRPAGGGGDDGPPRGGPPPDPGARGGPQRPSRGDTVRTVVRGVAQTCITVGLVLLLFSVYEVWFTGLVNGRTQDRLKNALERQWEGDGDDPVVEAQKPARPGAKVRSIPLGDGFALIYIPTFGKDYVYTIVQGTDPAELDQGPGHYPDSALPGQVGNFSIAGHRVGKGSPFLNLDKLRTGAPIVIRTRSFWYTYRVLGDERTNDPKTAGASGIPGMQIVPPTDVGVIEPVPGHSDVKPTQRLLTLTTCHPKFSARERLVIHAQLEGAPRPTSAGLPPALAAG
ncbi:MAG TPA: class E sortase, partial [Mycobacteriales bacterium]|nr:class E sortase [Mycobacteriales bacterium]